MTSRHKNLRLEYPSDTIVLVHLLSDVLRKHIGTVYRRFENASWTSDVKLVPELTATIWIVHDGSLGQTYFRERIYRETMLLRKFPPATVEPITQDMFLKQTAEPEPASASEPDVEADQPATTLRLGSTDHHLVTAVITAVLEQGHPVDVHAEGVTFRIHPK
jgi:hypothetical protein